LKDAVPCFEAQESCFCSELNEALELWKKSVAFKGGYIQRLNVSFSPLRFSQNSGA